MEIKVVSPEYYVDEPHPTLTDNFQSPSSSCKTCLKRYRYPLGFCGLFFFAWALSIMAFFIKLSNSNPGTECQVDFDSLTMATFNSNVQPVLEFTNCSSIPLSMLSFRGTHNSYKLKPKSEPTLWGLNTLVGPWKYEQQTLTSQLDAGFRHFEIDVHFGEDREHQMVFHLNLVDQQTVCYCISECLGQIRDWSLANPLHLPITIMFEVKYKHWLEAWREQSRPIDAEALDLLEKQVISAWRDARDKVVTPDDIKKAAGLTSLTDILTTKGWPTVDSMRGKTMFVMMDDKDYPLGDIYYGNSQSEQKAMFMMYPVDEDHPLPERLKASAAFLMSNNPLGKEQFLLDLSKTGYMVRTRANKEFETIDQYTETAKAAFNSGAAIVSLDGTDDEMIQIWKEFFGSETEAICSSEKSPAFCPQNIPC